MRTCEGEGISHKKLSIRIQNTSYQVSSSSFQFNLIPSKRFADKILVLQKGEISPFIDWKS